MSLVASVKWWCGWWSVTSSYPITDMSVPRHWRWWCGNEVSVTMHDDVALRLLRLYLTEDDQLQVVKWNWKIFQVLDWKKWMLSSNLKMVYIPDMKNLIKPYNYNILYHYNKCMLLLVFTNQNIYLSWSYTLVYAITRWCEKDVVR